MCSARVGPYTRMASWISVCSGPRPRCSPPARTQISSDRVTPFSGLKLFPSAACPPEPPPHDEEAPRASVLQSAPRGSRLRPALHRVRPAIIQPRPPSFCRTAGGVLFPAKAHTWSLPEYGQKGSCVLSPNSARNTRPNVTSIALRSSAIRTPSPAVQGNARGNDDRPAAAGRPASHPSLAATTAARMQTAPDPRRRPRSAALDLPGGAGQAASVSRYQRTLGDRALRGWSPRGPNDARAIPGRPATRSTARRCPADPTRHLFGPRAS